MFDEPGPGNVLFPGNMTVTRDSGRQKSIRRPCVYQRGSFHAVVVMGILFLFFIFPGIALTQNKTIAVFGSSVAKGSGDTTLSGGYAGLIRTLLEPRGWPVVNVSRGGDNTLKILPRFEKELLPLKPGYVIIGLSLGNEGIATGSGLARNRIFEQFRSGLLHLVRLCRENGMVPVVVNCYARNDFGPDQYEAVKKMNLLIASWDVPSINALGAIDDGTGKWSPGYWHDKSHPNILGHREIFYAFVPGLFDALAAGKKCPEKIRNGNALSVSEGASASPLVYTPADSMHSFTISFLVKSRGEGVVAKINGKDRGISVSLEKGKVVFSGGKTEMFSSDTTAENMGWQYVTVSHRYASGSTGFYVNGKLAGSQPGRFGFRDFFLGGSGDPAETAPSRAGYRDLLIYRSALNDDEVRCLYYGQLLQSSLEVYAPLGDSAFADGRFAENLAQSMAQVAIHGDHLDAVQETDVTLSK